MPDPLLTPLGETQCASLSAAFLYRPLITHLVSSPLRRTLYTTLLSFEDIILPAVGTGKKGIRVIALPEIQETSDLPCDTGSPVELLADEFAAGKWADTVDLGFVGEGWNDKSISTRWAPTPRNLEKRSKEARLWLRSLAREWEEAREGVEGEKDAHIAVVTHGGLLHFLTEDWSGYEKHLGTGWQNAEWRSYTFKSADDEAASLVETEASMKRREANIIPLTPDEERELRASGEAMWLMKDEDA